MFNNFSITYFKIFWKCYGLKLNIEFCLNLGNSMIYIDLATLLCILYGRSMVYSNNDVRFLPENLILHKKVQNYT